MSRGPSKTSRRSGTAPTGLAAASPACSEGPCLSSDPDSFADLRHLGARHLPRPIRRAVGFRAARRCLRTVFAVSLAREGDAVVARIPHATPVRATADGAACGFYAAAVAEVLRQLVCFDGAVRHAHCRAHGDAGCEWCTIDAPPGAE